MTGGYLDDTRAGYDAMAATYADRFHEWLDRKPVELAVLQAFAGLVGRDRHIVDVGCGTGATTVILARHGARVTGVDLSPGMIAKHESSTRSWIRASSTRRSTRRCP